MAERGRHPLIDSVVRCQQAEGISGNEVSRRLEINPSSWTRLVAGDMQPSIRIVRAIARAFPSLQQECVSLLLIGTTSSAGEQEEARAGS